MNPNIVYVGILKYLPIDEFNFHLPSCEILYEVANLGEKFSTKDEPLENVSVSNLKPKEKLKRSLKYDLLPLVKNPYFIKLKLVS